MATARARRILIVDDEQGIRRLVRRMLEDAGYEVVAVNDGLSGLEAVLTADAPYDLVITNNCMPRMSGIELVAGLRERRPHLPILHLDDQSGGGQAGLPSDVPNLYKPFEMELLLERVQELLQAKAAS